MKKSRNRSSAPPASSVAKTSLTAKAHSLTVPHRGRVAVAIMAAGKGTRLKSQLPKVLHEVGGKSLLAHVVAAATQVAARDIYAIVGYEAERVRAALEPAGIQFVLQAEQRGTGHALMAARQALAGYDHVIVLSGDAPLITAETVRRLLQFHLWGESGDDAIEHRLGRSHRVWPRHPQERTKCGGEGDCRREIWRVRRRREFGR